MWQWFNFAASQVPPLKEPLRINLDETSVCLYQGDAKGTVMCSRKRQRGGGGPVQRVGRHKRRTCLTHIALICDRPAVQVLLPQVLIGNCSTFLVRDWARMNAERPRNVYLLRQKSAWNNKGVMKQVIHLLGQALRPLAARFQPILLMDACRVHLHPGVARSCAAAGVRLVIVPAKLTWLLQPCDTHAFLKYKAYLKGAYQRLRVAGANNELDTMGFLQALYETIRKVLQGERWASAFDKDGFGAPPGQAAVSNFILRELALDAPPAIGAEEPTLDVLRLCFPRNAAIPRAALLQEVVEFAPAVPAAPLAPPALGALPAPMPLGVRLLPRRPAPAAEAAQQGVVTRAQSRLAAALAQGRPLPRPSGPRQ